MYGHRFTSEEGAFMEVYVPGHGYKEIQKTFTEKFGWEITINQVKSYIGNHKLNTGLTGRFKEGHIPANKGKKGIVSQGCEKGWFKKGHRPHNHKMIGSERITKDGYIEIKVEEPNRWKLKHRIVWENLNGKIPEGHIIIFKDGDKTNLDITNLKMIKKSTNAVLNHTGLNKFSGDFKDTAVGIAELKIEIARIKKENTKVEYDGQKKYNKVFG